MQQLQDAGLIPELGRSLEEEIATHSGILAWESHGQRSLAGYSPWGCKESDTVEATDAPMLGLFGICLPLYIY